MGYKREAKHYRLTFPDMAGFEVVMRRLSSEEFLTLTALASEGLGGSGARTMEAGREMFALLGKALVSWNLEEEDGTPVPASEDALLGQDWELTTALINGYLNAAAGVSPPLPGGSNGSRPQPEIPMRPLSPSLPS